MDDDAKCTTEELIALVRAGDHDSRRELFQRIYAELRRRAGACLGGESPLHTWSATDLVHETFQKLVRTEHASWSDRRHFLFCAAEAMRQLLVDHARGKKRMKRGGAARHAPLDDLSSAIVATAAGETRAAEEIEALDAALRTLAASRPDFVRIVELRFFVGLSMKEIAAVVEQPLRTVERRWRVARGWLRQALEGEEHGGTYEAL